MSALVRPPLQTDALTVRLITDPPGVIDAPARPYPTIVIHVGASVDVACHRGGHRHRGLAIHGDVDIVPPGLPAVWEIKQRDMALIIGVHNTSFAAVAEERGLDVWRVEIVNRFQTRDAAIEHIGWALKAEMETGHASGRLYVDSLATALAARLLDGHSSAGRAREGRVHISGRRLKQVLAYIEDNLSQDLPLTALASVAGLGVSQFNKVFRETIGVSAHQYVVQRRVERAKGLILEGKLSLADIAADAGFAHQSHLARHMRRLTGLSPRQLREEAYFEQ